MAFHPKLQPNGQTCGRGQIGCTDTNLDHFFGPEKTAVGSVKRPPNGGRLFVWKGADSVVTYVPGNFTPVAAMNP